MKSLNIRNIDPQLFDAIQTVAKRIGKSKSDTVKLLLREALNLQKQSPPKQDFSKFCGVWSKEEFDKFSEATDVFEVIDKNMWK